MDTANIVEDINWLNWSMEFFFYFYNIFIDSFQKYTYNDYIQN